MDLDKINNNVEELKKEETPISNNDRNLPNQLVIGFFENISKQELKLYIINYAQKYFEVPSKTYFAMKKYKDGYMYEIHDGKKDLSCLKNVIKKLDIQNEIIVKSKKRNLKIINNGNRIDTFLLNESDKVEGENLFVKGSMEYVIPKGTGLFIMGIVLAGLGTISITGAFVFKYVLYNQTTDNFKEKNISYELPLEKFNSLEAPTEYRYVSSLSFKNKEWSINYKDIPMPEEDLVEKNIDSELNSDNEFEFKEELEYIEEEINSKTDIIETESVITNNELIIQEESSSENINEDFNSLENDLNEVLNTIPEYYLEENDYYDGEKFNKIDHEVENTINEVTTNNIDFNKVMDFKNNNIIDMELTDFNDGKEPEYYLEENNYYDGDKHNDSIKLKVNNIPNTLNINSISSKIIIEEEK